jgi:hypothetical protein
MRVHFLSIQSEDELFLKQVSQFFIQQLDLVVSVLQLWPQSTKNLYSAWQGSSAVAGTTYAVSDNGWMQTNVFVSWFDTFLRQVKERPFLLVFDGHRTHIGLVKFMKEVSTNKDQYNTVIQIIFHNRMWYMKKRYC